MPNPEKIRSFFSYLLISILALGMLLAMRPLPSIDATIIPLPEIKAKAVNLPWPIYGQASVGAEGFGVLDSNGAQKPIPIASITKLVTALTVLQTKPLSSGEQGPTIVLSEKDVALYPSYLSRGGSVVPVAAGQQISQYQALQAMLIPSANNMADSLAIWAYGSMENYVKEANIYLKRLGLNMTSVADASGFSVESVSSSKDLVNLGIMAMKNPVIAGIVTQKQVEIPLAGTVYSTNRLLGESGIVGIKTGNTEEAGGCYLFAAKHKVEGQEILIVGAVLGAPSLYEAQIDSRRILEATKVGFIKTKLASKNQTLAVYKTPWGDEVPVVAKNDIELISWQARDLNISIKLTEFSKTQLAGTKAGTVEVSSITHSLKTDAVLSGQLGPPTPSWRILH